MTNAEDREALSATIELSSTAAEHSHLAENAGVQQPSEPPTKSSSTDDHRHDIDGLRAIAVLIVVV